MPLSYDWSAIKTAIDAMDPTGNTNQGIGLAWGWMTLGSGAAVQRAGQGYRELYLQGCHRPAVGRLNTQNRWY